MITLRDYQEDLVEKIRDAIRQGHRRILAVLETGGGKTVVAAWLGRAIAERGKRVWFCAHRNFLLAQTSITFRQVEIEHGFIASGEKCFMHPVMVCGVDTLRGRLAAFDPPDVLFLDEAHHVKAGSWQKIVDWAGDQCIIIGLTATPERLDGKGLGPPFETMVMGPTYATLRDAGHLSDNRCFVPTMIDRRRLAEDEVAGDFNAVAAEAMVEQQVVVSDILSWYRKLTEPLEASRAIYFCVSIAHSQRTAQRFQDAGIPFVHMDGKTPADQRIAIARALARREIHGITNCSLLGEGFDLAAQAGVEVTIDTVGLLRPTESLALHRQQMGRALRRKEYAGLIIDYVGNVKEHGRPEEEVAWSLEGRTKTKGEAPTKVCPSCTAVIAAAARTCPECGHEFLSEGGGPPTGIEGVLTEITDEFASERRKRAIRKAKRDRIAACKTLEDFKLAGKELGYKSGWAPMQFARYQEEQAAADRRAQDQWEAYRRQ
jgi:DNA repair protein RadD